MPIYNDEIKCRLEQKVSKSGKPYMQLVCVVVRDDKVFKVFDPMFVDDKTQVTLELLDVKPILTD